MKKTLFLIILLLTACTSAETKSLATEIKKDFQSRMDAQFEMFSSFGVFDDLGEDIPRPMVKDVKVFHIFCKKYIGLAKIELDGKQQTKIIHISIDEDDIYWEVDE